MSCYSQERVRGDDILVSLKWHQRGKTIISHFGVSAFLILNSLRWYSVDSETIQIEIGQFWLNLKVVDFYLPCYL